MILSDEIHSDLIYDPHRHLHIAALDERFARRTVTFIAPSKTFNMAGLSTSVVIVPDDSLRRRLQTELAKLHADQATYSEPLRWKRLDSGATSGSSN